MHTSASFSSSNRFQRSRRFALITSVAAAAMLSGCSEQAAPEQQSTTAETLMTAQTPNLATADAANSERNAYFGDLHVHTMYSFDAFIFGTTSSPDDAYEFAKGGTVVHPAGFDMTLDRPLDFYGVSDHAFYIGVLREMANPRFRDF